MTINLNDNILVKLNDRGKDIFYHQFDKILHEFPESGIKCHMPVVDENGYTEFQIWRFMELYGEHIGMGKPPILENMNVIYKEGSEESDVLNNGCWARLKDAFSDIESNEKEKSYFKVEGTRMVVEQKDYDLCKEECDYHFEECSDGHKNIIFTLNGKIKEDTGISRIHIRLDKCNLEEVVDAEWKEKNSNTIYCSACGFEEAHWLADEYKRCPNCGAKIRKSKKYLEDYISLC